MTRTVPEAGLRIPQRRRMVVVLPAPSGPTSANISLASMRRFRPVTAG